MLYIIGQSGRSSLRLGALCEMETADCSHDLAVIFIGAFHDPIALAHGIDDHWHLLFEQNLHILRAVRLDQRDLAPEGFSVKEHIPRMAARVTSGGFEPAQ